MGGVVWVFWVREDSELAVGLVDGTARYPRTAKFLQFGGRFDSEGVSLARIHIPQLLLLVPRCGLCERPLGKGGGLFGEGRGGATQADVCACGWALWGAEAGERSLGGGGG